MAAETIGVVTGLSTLITTTLHGMILLQKAIVSYEGHQKLVRDLLDELVTLTQVLNKLDETTKVLPSADFSMLEIPLRQCNQTCEALYEALQKCISRSNDSRTSFRDWARLKYMGEDIDGIRRLLGEYKMTINIALADANLRESSVTIEKIEACQNLLTTTKADLLDRLENIDERIEHMLAQKKGNSEEDISELKLIEEERLSTEKCLKICAQLADHISQIQLTARNSTRKDGLLGSSITPHEMVDEGFRGCVESLSRTTSKLEQHQKELFDRLVDKSKTKILSEQDRTDLAQLRDEWINTRHNLNIWSTAQSHLNDKISIIENHATGVAVQIMASTDGKVVHGINRGLGERSGQIGGYMDNVTLQQSLRVMEGIFGPTTLSRNTTQDCEATAKPVDEPVEKLSPSFQGKGFQLSSNSSSTYTTTRLMKSAENNHELSIQR